MAISNAPSGNPDAPKEGPQKKPRSMYDQLTTLAANAGMRFDSAPHTDEEGTKTYTLADRESGKQTLSVQVDAKGTTWVYEHQDDNKMNLIARGDDAEQLLEPTIQKYVAAHRTEHQEEYAAEKEKGATVAKLDTQE
jgi:hypothetical protein